MHFHISQYSLFLRIGVAVAAKVTAGVIGANVSREITGAFLPVVRIRRDGEILADGGFKGFHRHAARAVRTQSGERRAFPTGLDGHAIFLSGFHKGGGDGLLIVGRNSPCFREVSFHFFIQIDEADDGGVGIAGEPGGHEGNGSSDKGSGG